MKLPNLLVGILMVVLALLAGCGHGEKSPSEVVKALYEAANAGKYSAVEHYFCADARRYIKVAYPRGLKPLCDAQTKYGTLTQVDIVQVEIKGDEAYVTARLRFKDRTTLGEKTKLIKEKGEWKVALGR